MRIVDMHCDTLIEGWRKPESSFYDGKGTYVNVKLLKEHESLVQFFAIYLSREEMETMGDYNLLKAEYERLVAQQKAVEDAQKALAKKEKQAIELQDELKKLEEQLKNFKEQPIASPAPTVEEVPLPEEPPVKEENTITAQDDLFFDEPEEIPVKPTKDKKKRHEHNHINPYQQKAQEKVEKGYTQQRQYSFFDIDEK